MSKKSSDSKRQSRTIFIIKPLPAVLLIAVVFALILVAISLLFSLLNHLLWLYLVIALFASFVVLIFLYLKPWAHITSKGMNHFDIYIVSFAFGFLLYGIICIPNITFLFSDAEKHIKCIPHYLAFTLSFLLFVFFAWRIQYTRKAKGPAKRQYYLYDFVDGLLPDSQEEAIISDTDVHYDLFKRKPLIDEICNALKKRNGNGKVVIGITGEWGSGKTTYLNVALDWLRVNDKNLIVARGFSAWKYSDERSFLIALINHIYEKLDIGVSDSVINSSIVKYVNMFLSNNRFNIGNISLTSSNNEKTAINVINEYLVQNDKHLVVVIDNIDRLRANEIRFVYKAVGDIVDIKNTTFVCLYDEQYVEKAFSPKNVDVQNFLDKIINLKIEIGRPSPDKFYNAGVSALLNYFKKFKKGYDFEKRGKKEFDLLAEAIKLIPNVRTLIVVLNTLFNFVPLNDDSLDYIDYFCINILKKTNYQLYTFIVRNASVFVIARRDYLSTYSFSDSKENIDKQRKEMISSYFDEGRPYQKYRNFLNLLFPNSLYEYGASLTREEIVLANTERRIYSGKFFENYIKDTKNSYYYLYEEIKKIFLNSVDFVSFSKSIYTLFILHPDSEQEELLGTIDESSILLKDNSERLQWLLIFLFKNYYVFSQTWLFFRSARLRSVSAMCKILGMLDQKTAESYLLPMKNDVTNITLLGTIERYFKLLLKNHEIEDDHIRLFCKKLLAETANYIYDKGIDVFSKKYYRRGILFILKENSDKEVFEDYISNIVDKNNVYCFLCELIASGTTWTDDKKPYFISIKKEHIELFLSLHTVKELIREATVLTDGDAAIKEIVDQMKEDDREKETEYEKKYSERPKDIWSYYEKYADWFTGEDKTNDEAKDEDDNSDDEHGDDGDDLPLN